MAADYERLLAYFQRHHLSRQEVLYKLPLNIPIERFWEELLTRRKGSASFLPLHSAEGRPYWYALTDRMIAASERLCEEAMRQEGEFDPYRFSMTSAMTEEMFFTSYVEGAQIQMADALDFLSARREPENVQEQMIFNNRQAWSAMIGGLFRPMDEEFVKTLAFLLTDEMEGRAEDYRKMDEHPIAAMGGEAYTLPAARLLPERMSEFYEYLARGDVHPLVKAAVGQAYVLVTRPFPEGNERLSRMISSAVLLRGGYDFFRDISLSGMIARESYRYYKAMKEILRSENGGDFTYFMEYFLEMLVRALDLKRERELLREEQSRNEALQRERELGRKPLERETTVSETADNALSAREEHSAGEAGEGEEVVFGEGRDEPLPVEILPEEAVSTNALQRPTVSAWEHPAASDEEYRQRVREQTKGLPVRQNRITDTLTAFYQEGKMIFSLMEWREKTGLDRKKASTDCCSMVRLGLIARCDGGVRIGKYRILNGNQMDAAPPIPDVPEAVRMPEAVPILKAITPERRNSAEEALPDDAPRLTDEDVTAIRKSLYTCQRHKLDLIRRTAKTLLGLLDKGAYIITREDWKSLYPESKHVAENTLRAANNMGYLRQTKNGAFVFALPDVWVFEEIPQKQKRFVDNLILKYHRSPFTSCQIVEDLKITPTTVEYYIRCLTQRGVLTETGKEKNTRLLTFTDAFWNRWGEREPAAPVRVSAAAAGRMSVAL